eukprot:g6690.t1
MSKPSSPPASGCLYPITSLLKRTFSQKSNKNMKEGLEGVLQSNKEIVEEKLSQDSEYYSRHAGGQAPEFLYIGCADSRVPPNEIMNRGPGEIFCHRNVGNVVSGADANCMAVLEYSIGSLKVKHVIVCGHYGCGACNAALNLPADTPGMVNGFIQHIRTVRDKWWSLLNAVSDDKKWKLLCELNCLEQTRNVCLSQAVQKAWASGQELYVHAVLYDLETGLLKVMAPAIDSTKRSLELDRMENGLLLKETPMTKVLMDGFTFSAY